MPVEIVAEMGANHGRSFDKAIVMIRAAAKAGADAVKVSMFFPEQMAPDSDDPKFQITNGPWSGRTLYDLYREAAMPIDWVPDLMTEARENDVKFIAAVYHPAMVAVAEEYGIERYKIASFEIAYLDLWDRVLETGKPIIASTGVATLSEIEDVVRLCQGKGLTLLKCVSQYPASLESMNLQTLFHMELNFSIPGGLSDHTLGDECAVIATALGASMIEKHFKIDDVGLDSAFSLNPEQFAEMVRKIREAETILGTVNYEPVSTQYKRKLVDGQWVRTTT